MGQLRVVLVAVAVAVAVGMSSRSSDGSLLSSNIRTVGWVRKSCIDGDEGGSCFVGVEG